MFGEKVGSRPFLIYQVDIYVNIHILIGFELREKTLLKTVKSLNLMNEFIL